MLFRILACLLIYTSYAWGFPQESRRIAKVVDGDTIRLLTPSGSEIVRLIGIDAPETSPSPKARKQADRSDQRVSTIIALGERSSQYLRSLLHTGDTVRVEYDEEHRDQYGRLLAYVYLQDGTFINEKIVRSGYANILTVPPNTRYREILRSAYNEARDSHRGLWSFEGFDE